MRQVRGDGTVHDSQSPGHGFGVTGKQKPQRKRNAKHPLAYGLMRQNLIDQLDGTAGKFWQVLESRPGLLQSSAEAMQYRWMLEEFRVSLFAQSLGTRQAISEKRLEAQWGKLSAWLVANPH